MSVLEWKHINLFKVLPYTEYPNLKNIKGDLEYCCYNNHYKVICTDGGWVHVYQKNWDCMSFQADTRPIKLSTICGITSSILLTLSQDESSNDIYLQVFNLQKMSKKNGALYLGSAKLQNVSSSANILEAYTIDSQMFISIGFERGDISLFKGPISRDMSPYFKIYSITNKAITGIGFKQLDSSSIIMFICSNAGVFSFNLNDHNTFFESKNVLDSEKEKSRIGVMRENTSSDSYFTVARDDAVYCFTTDGRGPCYVLNGEKKCLQWFGNYLIVALKQKKNSYDEQETAILIMVDIINKMIVLNKEFQNIWSLIVDNGRCLVLTMSKEIFVLRERNTKSKINILLKKNMFDVALNQLGDIDSDLYFQAKVNLLYGDYLFQKTEIEKAIDRYIKTIGFVEPYCIIQKLLDSRYTKHLISYLESLLRTEYGTREHYELLLNCSERLEMPAQVENQCYNGYANADFILPSSPRICEREFKVNGIALDNYSAFVEVIHDLNRVFKFFETKEEQDILTFLLSYQHILDVQFPGKILKILKQLIKKCKIKNPEKFAIILFPNYENIVDYLEYVIENNRDCSSKIYSLLFKHYLESWKQGLVSETSLLEYLKKYDDHLCNSNQIILCRMYNFWNGIIYYLRKSYYNYLCSFYLLKSSNVKHISSDSEDVYNTTFILKTLQSVNLDLQELSDFAINFLGATFQEKPSSVLQIMEYISSIKHITVGSIKEFFNQDFLKKITGICSSYVKSLEEELLASQNLCQSYSTHPIEFRNSICEICRQELIFPAVYFLCQHAFHKECINHYSEENICVVCFNTASKLHGSNTEDRGIKRYSEEYFENTFFLRGAVNEIGQLLHDGIFNDLVMEQSSTSNIKILSNQSNPFECDDNEIEELITQSQSNIVLNPSKKEHLNIKRNVPNINTNPFEVNTNPFEDSDDNLSKFPED